jgi:hypothetical protein
VNIGTGELQIIISLKMESIKLFVEPIGAKMGNDGPHTHTLGIKTPHDNNYYSVRTHSLVG